MKNILILIGFILINLAIRWVSIWGPPLDDDEGIYLLMGRFILEGHLPYVHYWDHQPPLIYYLSAFAQLFSQEQALAGVRIIAAVFTGTTAWIIFCLYRILFQSCFFGLLCGVVYSLWIYSPGFNGWAYNNEILFNTFTSGSLLILFLYFENSWRGRQLVFWSGVCMGMGFLTKQNVLFDCIPFMFLIFLFKSRFSVKNLFFYGLGCLLPHAGFALWYLLHGNFSIYLFANLTSNMGYIKYETVNKLQLYDLFCQAKYYIVFIPLSFLVRFNLSKTILIKEKSLKIFFFCWISFILYGTTISKTFYPHYYLQLFPGLSLLSVSLLQRFQFSKMFISFVMSPVLCTLFIYSFIPLKMKVPQSNYLEKDAARYITAHKQSGDTLFVFDSDVILYYWTQLPILTRYAFPIHLIKQKYAKAFRLDQEKEINSVLKQRPTWIVTDIGMKNSYRDSDSIPVQIEFYSIRDKYYSLQKIIKDKAFDNHLIEIYKKKTEQ